MCTEQKHASALFTGRTVAHNGKIVKNLVGARNWAAFHDPIADFQRALTLGLNPFNPSRFVFDCLFSFVTLQYQGFKTKLAKGEVVFCCYDTEFCVRSSFVKDFAKAISMTIAMTDIEDEDDMVTTYLGWYTHKVAAFHAMPFPDVLWCDMLNFCVDVWPELANYEISHNDGHALLDGTESEVIELFLDEHRFDVNGSMLED